MSKHIVNSRWGRDRVASDIYWHLSWKSIPSTRCYIYFCVLPDFDQNPKKHFFRCAAECVWCLGWVGATLHCLSAAKTRLCAAPQGTTAWNAVRQCASRRPWLDEPGPPPSLELKIAGFELKLADTNKGVTSSNKLRRAQAGGACSSGSQAKQTWLSATIPSPVQQL